MAKTETEATKPSDEPRQIGDDNARRTAELCRIFPLQPITDDETLARALKVVDDLIDVMHLSQSERAYLDLMHDLIWVYEETQEPR